MKLIERVWARCEKLPDGGCWIWNGAKTPRGYGKIARDGKFFYVHRLALEEGIGRPIPSFLVAMHSCDNPSCCNPAHLRLGTKAQNSAEMVEKRRSKFGERHHNARLSAEQVAEIRKRHADGETQRALSRAYGVTFQHVSTIVNNGAWRAA